MVYLENITNGSIREVLNQFGLVLNCVASSTEIPYSFWGTPKAGRKYNPLFIHFDTHLHSILHEASHYVSMPQIRRSHDSHDASGGILE